jgi:hypothetical protein
MTMLNVYQYHLNYLKKLNLLIVFDQLLFYLYKLIIHIKVFLVIIIHFRYFLAFYYFGFKSTFYKIINLITFIKNL